MQRKGDDLVYRYDYGDDWEHLVLVESVMHADDRLQYPLCIGGARACPPEDCGEVNGYEELLRVLASPKDPEHDGILTWVGGYFDPTPVNRALRLGS